MNRRSFISKIVQGGTVLATGLPEKLLSSEANTVDKVPIEILMCDHRPHRFCGCPADDMRGWGKFKITLPRFQDEENYVYVGEPVSPNVLNDYWYGRFSIIEPDGEKRIKNRRLFVHKKYFLVSLLMNTKNKKT